MSNEDLIYSECWGFYLKDDLGADGNLIIGNMPIEIKNLFTEQDAPLFRINQIMYPDKNYKITIIIESIK